MYDDHFFADIVLATFLNRIIVSTDSGVSSTIGSSRPWLNVSSLQPAISKSAEGARNRKIVQGSEHDMATGVIIVILIIAGSLIIGALIARRRQLQQARLALEASSAASLHDDIPLGASNPDGARPIRRPEPAHIPEPDILPAYEPAPEYAHSSKVPETTDIRVV